MIGGSGFEHAQLDEILELKEVLDEYEARLAIKDEIIRCLDLKIAKLEDSPNSYACAK